MDADYDWRASLRSATNPVRPLEIVEFLFSTTTHHYNSTSPTHTLFSL